MPVPFILLGAAAVAGLWGASKGAGAIRDNRRARELYDRAEDLYDAARAELEAARERTAGLLEELGRVKLEAWERQLGRFAALFPQIKEVNVTGAAAAEFELKEITPAELAEMKQISLSAKEVLTGGAAALGTGALVGVASYGGAVMFAHASTGTAIGALTGAAAKNATLAWFGGGSLAAGGLGMAGGAAVLGGLVAAPVLAVGGFMLSKKAEKNLAEARRNMAEARRAAAEMDAATAVVSRIGEVAAAYTQVITEVEQRMTGALDDLEALIDHRLRTASWWRKKLGNWRVLDYRRFTPGEQRTVHVAMLFAQTLKRLLETPLLTPEGAVDERSEALLEELAGSALPEEVEHAPEG